MIQDAGFCIERVCLRTHKFCDNKRLPHVFPVVCSKSDFIVMKPA